MSEIDAILQNKVASIKEKKNSYTVGKVKMVREYVVEATGLEDVAYFEHVTIGDKAEGYVDLINRDSVLIALTKVNEKVEIGDDVIATGKEFTAYFSPNYIGNVVNIFGMNLLNDMKFNNLVKIPVESAPVPIIDRTAVTRPLQTGITGIDMLYPIGRGQRQLIIGDKRTGKTQIALDTILNQKDAREICIYVAIGKTKKEVKNIYRELLKRGAMSYTIIVAAFNDECAPVLKSTPYAAVSMANLLMLKGADVLVVLDDLKRHADVCREIALLMDKTPGRDAYPPDIFYSHSRLLEMGCQHKNGGSITILPIGETKGEDITDYISTNIISITDGQIVLSKKSFDKGQKPAINYGLSVSRLGGAVQTSDMKKMGTSVRRELLAYLEQKEIFELANVEEMSAQMRNTMQRGAKIMDVLKQDKFAVRTHEEMLNSVKSL